MCVLGCGREGKGDERVRDWLIEVLESEVWSWLICESQI